MKGVPAGDSGPIQADDLVVMLGEAWRGLRLKPNGFKHAGWVEPCPDQRKDLVTLETILSQVSENDVGGQGEREMAEFDQGTAGGPGVRLRVAKQGGRTLRPRVCLQGPLNLPPK